MQVLISMRLRFQSHKMGFKTRLQFHASKTATRLTKDVSSAIDKAIQKVGFQQGWGRGQSDRRFIFPSHAYMDIAIAPECS